MNDENLIPLDKRNQEDRKKIASMGGKASGVKKRLAKDMRESMKVLLNMPVTKTKQREILGEYSELLDDYSVTMADVLNLKMLIEAGEGSAKHFEVARDTGGYKPIDQVQTDINILSEADKALLAKVAKRTGVDQKQ